MVGDNHQRREGDRRQIHDDCTAHSGMNARLNINLILNGIACVLLAVLLSLAIDTHSALESQAWRMNRVENDVDNLRNDVNDVDTRIASIERKR